MSRRPINWSSEAEQGKRNQNVLIGRLNGKFRNECLNQHWRRSLDEALRPILRGQKRYNQVGSHSALGYLPPAEYAKHVDYIAALLSKPSY